MTRLACAVLLLSSVARADDKPLERDQFAVKLAAGWSEDAAAGAKVWKQMTVSMPDARGGTTVYHPADAASKITFTWFQSAAVVHGSRAPASERIDGYREGMKDIVSEDLRWQFSETKSFLVARFGRGAAGHRKNVVIEEVGVDRDGHLWVFNASCYFDDDHEGAGDECAAMMASYRVTIPDDEMRALGPKPKSK